jgi:putative intracellular protease/amidase
MAQRILLPVPDRDFDATEVAVPWRSLTDAGHDVVIATERGAAPRCDRRTLDGPVLGLFGASDEARRFYRELERAQAFLRPAAWEGLEAAGFDGLFLPGGHARGMRPYLESVSLQNLARDFFRLERPVAAICHGVLVLARARDPRTGKSVLSGRRTTCLPKYMERAAYLGTAWMLGRYYRTYRAYVEDEVRGALDAPDRTFLRGPLVLDMRRVVRAHADSAFVVEDGRYLSARWPGDAHALAERFVALLAAVRERPAGAEAPSPRNGAAHAAALPTEP